jgi:PAS domain S-box-containing protein
MSDEELAEQSAAYIKRREEELYSAVTEKARQEILIVELTRSGADAATIKAVIAAKAQIERDIPIIGRDLSLSAQSANLSTFLRRMEVQGQQILTEIGGLRGGTAALQAEFRSGLSGIQATVSNLLETVDDLQKQMRESQDDRADLRRRIDAISTSQAVFAASMLLSAHAVIVVDPQQRIQSVNQKVFTYFGYSADELIGQRLDILIPVRFRAAHRRHIEAFAASGETQRLMADRHEVYGLHRDGSEFLIRAAIVKISDGFIAVVERTGDG